MGLLLWAYMARAEIQQQKRVPIEQDKMDEIFADFKARSNIVGLFDLLLKIDRRNNPSLYRLPESINSET